MYKLLLNTFVLVLCFSAQLFSQVEDRIEFNDQYLFLNGGNVAWVNFAADIGPGRTNMEAFNQMYKQVSDSGANAMRLWLHTTGAVTPAWDGNTVTGPGEGTIEDLRAILDAAWAHDVGLILCLWSFDMLRIENGDTVTDRAKALLEDSVLTQRYIDNALVPMVEELGDHPAVIAWEIFNEAEGMSNEFGWDFNRHVPMTDIQRFVNQTAGAIHRTNDNAQVSTGAWSFHVLWDETGHEHGKNYYSDEELIETGGDTLGYLDFYMVHYYPWAQTEMSPFHHDKSHWDLDKPLVVGEFGIEGNGTYGVPVEEHYQELYGRGYAGALAWQWFDWYADRIDQHYDSWVRALPQMFELSLKYPSEIAIVNDDLKVLYFKAEPREIEAGQESVISWDVRNATSVKLQGESVDTTGQFTVSPEADTTFRLISNGQEGEADTSEVTINVLSSLEINRARGKEATASSEENAQLISAYAFDGDMSTRWSSDYADGEWIYVDLDTTYAVKTVQLTWETAYGEMYSIDVSQDAESWTTVYEENEGDGGTDLIEFNDPVAARYVRMNGDTRATQWGFSLFEFEVMGLPTETPTHVSESKLLPEKLTLHQNYPNPFNPTTTIKYTLPSAGAVKITIYNSLGQIVQTLIDAVQQPGIHKINWNAASNSSGMYLYRLQTEQGYRTQTMILLK